MPHRCLACSRLYPDDAQEVLKGCSCGKTAFLFVRADAPDVAEGIASPKEGSYALDLPKLLLGESAPKAEEGGVQDRLVRSRKDGTFEIDLRTALGVDKKEE